MYDKRLDGFLKTAEFGSFARAGEALFISGNAVLKQVNGLERDLGVALLRRTNRGVELTDAGKVLLHEAHRLMADAEALAKRVRDAADNTRCPVRLAASQMRPPTHIRRLWACVADRHPAVELQIVQISDTKQEWESVAHRLGDKVDALFTIEPLSPMRDNGIPRECRKLFDSPMCVAVPLSHPLAGKQLVTFSDLEHSALYVQERGSTGQVDKFIDYVTKKHSSINLVQVAPYAMEAYNTAAHFSAPILNCRDLGELHPGFVNIECEWGWDYVLPFCLMWRHDANPVVWEFTDAICGEASLEQADMAMGI